MSGTRNEKYIKAFGHNLRRLRLSKKLTQEDFAFRCGFPPSQIGRFERGDRSPTLSSLYALAEGLEIEPKKLLDF